MMVKTKAYRAYSGRLSSTRITGTTSRAQPVAHQDTLLDSPIATVSSAIPSHTRPTVALDDAGKRGALAGFLCISTAMGGQTLRPPSFPHLTWMATLPRVSPLLMARLSRYAPSAETMGARIVETCAKNRSTSDMKVRGT